MLTGASAGLAAEPTLGAGVFGALQLALSKGYLERAGAAPQGAGAAKHLLTARHYSIEDKTYGYVAFGTHSWPRSSTFCYLNGPYVPSQCEDVCHARDFRRVLAHSRDAKMR